MRLFGYFLMMSFFACTQRQTVTAKSFFSEERVKKAYLELLEDTSSNNTGNITIFRDSSELSPDKSLLKFFPYTEFWRLTIRNAYHYDYGAGSIPAVVAFSKLDSNDIRILFPFLYAESSKNFFDLFYNTPIKEKDNCCRAITNIFLKTRRISLFCNEELYQFDQTTDSTNKQYTITTSWQQKCNKATGIDTYREYTDSGKIKTRFFFKGNKIKEIDYQDWVRQGRRRQ